ncbi:DEAD/DEAH box helicase [Phenylobacterium immobile]|uniref:DEAD/DEAH box helicase n=1 Tax=Phenylobacterium immobile TaxID=21 RepID=UPI000AA7D782|nr:DEAD/DEAH box helicase [Phenylobacterium immobile]
MSHQAKAQADEAGADRLTPGPAASPQIERVRQTPAAAVAATLANHLAAAKPATFVHLASSERRADEIGRALTAFAPDAQVVIVPPWDCLPYDRASPSRDVMARRMRVLEVLETKPETPRAVIASPEALSQRLPPVSALAAGRFTLERGRRLDREALAAFAEATGYVADDRIDEPGEIAILGEVVDIFPGDSARPLRIVTDADGRITEIRVYDPLTQRSVGELDGFSLGPASELIFDASAPHPAREPGAEHGLAQHYGALPSLFDLASDASLSRDDLADDRLQRFEEQLLEAFEAQKTLSVGATPAAPSALYIHGQDLQAGLKAWRPLSLDRAELEPAPQVAASRNPGRAFCDLVERHRAAGDRVVLTGLRHELRAMGRALVRGLELDPVRVESWRAALDTPPGGVVAAVLDLDAGFTDASEKLVVLAASDVLGGRLAERSAANDPSLFVEPELRLGDVVIHEDHGVGVLRALEPVEVAGVEREVLKLEYYGGAHVLAPIEEIGRIWRYGAEEAAVTLDRLKGDGWIKRRAEVSRHIDETARTLVEMAKAREAAECPAIVPPKAAYAKFAARFAYPETPDQAAAIAAVLEDLARGRPMDRLICGDVGFGKTEVALRAAAAVALAGHQVAVVAPTTVLARQHLQTFERRFAGTGLRIAQLSRLVSPGEARAVKADLAAREVDIVIGTHAIANGAAFPDLGLMIIDEEQKFGAAIKAQLRDMARGGHLLTLTATPIPRTLQAAMVGLQEVSVIASPPARRRPIRTFLAPFDAATVRTALLREKRRGGQSFVVVPRIEDIRPLAERLGGLAPELAIRIAHGDLTPEAVDQAMVGFADGDGDVLLATNIIESGLDVPRANTMLVWRPDRFGLSQLHQLRGRVGRGRTQGVAYLLSDPKEDLSEATRARLSTLEAFDRLGSGLAISARDLDLRGAGDLVGDEQAGHMQMIGAALYQRALHQALRAARGEVVEADWTPTLNLGDAGCIPSAYVPDPAIRITVYSRLARLESVEAIDAFEEELADRFGPLPAEAAALLGLARLQRLARTANVRRVSAGPKGIALSLTPDHDLDALRRAKPFAGADIDGERLLAPAVAGNDLIGTVEQLLTAVARASR